MRTTTTSLRRIPSGTRATGLPPARRLVALGLIGAAAAGAVLGVVPAASAAGAPTDAVISNFSFSPDPVTIPVGGTVKWTNDDNATHTITADDGSFDSGFKSLHGTFTQTFNQAGSFAYHCNVHSGMHGTVEVGSATTTTTVAPTTTTTAAPTTTTTVRATTTTVPTPTTQAPASTGGAPGPTSPSTATSTAPRATTPKATAPNAVPPTAARAATGPQGATTATLPAAAPSTPPPAAPTAAPSPSTASDDAPASAETTPPTEVASGLPQGRQVKLPSVTTPRPGDGGGLGGTVLGLSAALAALLLGAAGFVVARIRRARA